MRSLLPSQRSAAWLAFLLGHDDSFHAAHTGARRQGPTACVMDDAELVAIVVGHL